MLLFIGSIGVFIMKNKLEEQYTKNPKATEGIVFYYEIYKEPIKKEES